MSTCIVDTKKSVSFSFTLLFCSCCFIFITSDGSFFFYIASPKKITKHFASFSRVRQNWIFSFRWKCLIVSCCVMCVQECTKNQTISAITVNGNDRKNILAPFPPQKYIIWCIPFISSFFDAEAILFGALSIFIPLISPSFLTILVGIMITSKLFVGKLRRGHTSKKKKSKFSPFFKQKEKNFLQKRRKSDQNYLLIASCKRKKGFRQQKVETFFVDITSEKVKWQWQHNHYQ